MYPPTKPKHRQQHPSTDTIMSEPHQCTCQHHAAATQQSAATLATIAPQVAPVTAAAVKPAIVALETVAAAPQLIAPLSVAAPASGVSKQETPAALENCPAEKKDAVIRGDVGVRDVWGMSFTPSRVRMPTVLSPVHTCGRAGSASKEPEATRRRVPLYGARKTATLGDFVESLRRRNRADTIANADSLSCGVVWFREYGSSSGGISQHIHVRHRVPVAEVTVDHLAECNTVSLYGDFPITVGTLLDSMEPLVEAHGNALFSHGDKRVVLSAADQEIAYRIVPPTDDRLFKETGQVMGDLGHYGRQLRALCSTVLSKYGDGPISVEGVYADLVEQLPKAWVTEVVLIDRTLVPMDDFATRFETDGMPTESFDMIFATRSPAGLGDYVFIDDAAKLPAAHSASKQIFLHVPKYEGMTMEMMDMVGGNSLTRMRCLVSALEKKRGQSVVQ